VDEKDSPHTSHMIRSNTEPVVDLAAAIVEERRRRRRRGRRGREGKTLIQVERLENGGKSKVIYIKCCETSLAVRVIRAEIAVTVFPLLFYEDKSK